MDIKNFGSFIYGIYQSCNAAQAALFGLDNSNDIADYTNKTSLYLKKILTEKRLWETNLKNVINSREPLQFESPLNDLNGQ